MKAMILALSVLTLAACGKGGSGPTSITAAKDVTIDPALVGTWVGSSDSSTFTVKPDGKEDRTGYATGDCVLTDHFTWTSTGDVLVYTFINSTVNQCTSHLLPTDRSVVLSQAHYSISGNQLTLVSLDGTSTAVFTKK